MLLVDKPAGVTSHDVVARARRALGTGRIGHTGTLDPFATGLLVLLVGRATRLLPFVDGEPKVYEATIRFGAETATDDLTGEVVRQAPIPADPDVDAAMCALTGDIDQTPPAYSAKKVQGRRAYHAARRGQPLELAPVRVRVLGWTVLARRPAELDVRIVCGGGTYIRALARDLGRLAHSAAHLTSLRRLSSGRFTLDKAIPAPALDAPAAAREALLPMHVAVAALPEQQLDPDELGRVRHGHDVAPRVDAPLVSLVSADGSLVAVARREGGRLRPKAVLCDD